MTKRGTRTICGAAVSVFLPFATFGCVGQDSSPPAAGVSEVYSVAVMAATVGSLPQCGAALTGTVARVDSPPSLWRCSSGRWNQISCDTSAGGNVAYASSPPTLWACVHNLWTQVALPDAGPPGPQGPAGPRGLQGATGEAGVTPTIAVTPEPAGPNCAAGGIRVDVDSDGTSSTAYVCNGVSAGGLDGGLDASEAEAGPNAAQQYLAQYAGALCNGIYDCCEAYDAGFDEAAVASCEGTVLSGSFEWETTLPGPATYAAGNLQVNSASATACLAALSPLSCGTFGAAQYQAITNDCFGVLTGAIAAGAGGCIDSFECASGYCNLPIDAGTGTCMPLVVAGGVCLTQDMCSQASLAPAMYCTTQVTGSSPGTCQALLADGANCGGADMACASGLCAGNNFSTCGGNFANPDTGDAGSCP
jgi:hypothetical protein